MKQRGLLIILIAAIGLPIAFLLSSGWYSEAGFIPNLLHVLRLQLFERDQGYLIDVPTKYVLSVLLLFLLVGVIMHRGLLGGESNAKPMEKRDE